MDILQEVKLRLGLKNDDTKDNILTSYINQIEVKIKNYCNRTTIPEGLLYVWVAMVIDLYNVVHSNILSSPIGTNGSGNKEVEEVSRGDVTIKYSNNVENLKNYFEAADKFLDKVVVNYSRELNRYRKVRVL